MIPLATRLRADAIRAVMQEGETVEDAAELLCLSPERVRLWLEEVGYVCAARPADGMRQVTPQPVRAAALERLAEGVSAQQIARELGVPRSTVWQWGQRYGNTGARTYLAVLYAGTVYPRAVRAGDGVRLRAYGRDSTQIVPWDAIEAWAPRASFRAPASGRWQAGPAARVAA